MTFSLSGHHYSRRVIFSEGRRASPPESHAIAISHDDAERFEPRRRADMRPPQGGAHLYAAIAFYRAF